MSEKTDASPARLAPFTADDNYLECAACGTFIELSDPPAADWRRHERLRYLREAIEARRGRRSPNVVRFSQGLVMEQAAERYFRLIEQAQASLKGWFDGADFSLLLTRNPSPVWHDHDCDLAALVLKESCADTQEIQPGLRELARRLAKLSSLQQAAVVDACERVLRGYENPLL